MRQARWPRIKDVLETAVELGTARREAFLKRACGGDPELDREVRSLLAVEDRAEEILAAPVLPEVGTEIRLPDRIGAYHILERLGEGGMGVVYLAEQDEPARRRVALKLVRSSLLDPWTRRRFEVECQALARMNHPHVAQVYEAGTTGEGLPFIAMEYVPGLSITRYCARHRLTLSERLELVLGVCDALQHAHQSGVIHRDVKPSNVLVTAGPAVKVIDFGIAKTTDPRRGETRSGPLLGTLPYMSPEALVRGPGSGAVDTRSDIYALGVLLYEILVGVQPFDTRNESLVETVRRLTEGRPPRPSARFKALDAGARSRLSAERRCRGSALVQRLSGDLDWIVLKALAREREGRYATVGELKADIERHRRHLPVLAGPPGRHYRAGKLLRRHAVAATLIFAFGALLVAFSMRPHSQ